MPLKPLVAPTAVRCDINDDSWVEGVILGGQTGHWKDTVKYALPKFADHKRVVELQASGRKTPSISIIDTIIKCHPESMCM
jgi:hypothetical protein